MSHMSAWEPKFMRARYIRVVAIDIVANAGIKNIYVIPAHKNILHRMQQTNTYHIERI